MKQNLNKNKIFPKIRSKHTATCTQVENNSSEGNNVSGTAELFMESWSTLIGRQFNCSFSFLWNIASTKQLE